ncbi:hypothetical protein ACFOLF_15045 [Paenibacillus sepulcri]|uniref:Uncharacterized protein n=1 Tax=Paenibacillus sepulcri TaxID=359917 RepID=A0ABS7C1I2_9BACL|nr:hypothetical protein [Paenibacillus sepulcri]
MLDFSFELIDDSIINIHYQYGSTVFIFTLFMRDEEWTLHPFDGILLQNKEMCAIVVTDLLKNKDFHVLLARENITLSALRTSIDLRPEGSDEYTKPSPQPGRDEKTDFIEAHSFEEVLQLEKEMVQERIAFFQDIIQRMYMDGYGPEDNEFNKVQSLIRIYKETYERLGTLDDIDFKGKPGKRW